MFTRTYVLFTLVCLLLLGACAGSGAGTMEEPAPEQSEAMSETTTEETATEETATEEMADSEVAAGETMTDSQSMEDTTSGETAETTDATMAEDETADSEAMTDTTSSSEGSEGSEETTSDTTVDLPAWQTIALTDARTGETFTLADFAGKTVFVETMATWCPNCRQQLGNVKSAAARADSEQVVFVAISVETDLSAETLAQYADNNDFGWTFAVATPELVQALGATFGPSVANPPVTPHFLIFPDGTHSDLVTGYESGDAILEQIG